MTVKIELTSAFVKNDRDLNFDPFNQYLDMRQTMKSSSLYKQQNEYFESLEKKLINLEESDFKIHNGTYIDLISKILSHLKFFRESLTSHALNSNEDFQNHIEQINFAFDTANDHRVEFLPAFDDASAQILTVLVEELINFTESKNESELEAIQVCGLEMWEWIELIVLNPMCPRSVLWTIADYMNVESNIFAEANQSSPWICFALAGNSLIGPNICEMFLDAQRNKNETNWNGISLVGVGNLYMNPSIPFSKIEEIDPKSIAYEDGEVSMQDYLLEDILPELLSPMGSTQNLEEINEAKALLIFCIRGIWEISIGKVSVDKLLNSDYSHSQLLGKTLAMAKTSRGGVDNSEIPPNIDPDFISNIDILVKQQFTPYWRF